MGGVRLWSLGVLAIIGGLLNPDLEWYIFMSIQVVLFLGLGYAYAYVVWTQEIPTLPETPGDPRAARLRAVRPIRISDVTTAIGSIVAQVIVAILFFTQ